MTDYKKNSVERSCHTGSSTVSIQDAKKQKEEAFFRLERVRKKGTITDYKAELNAYREEKYGQ